ncbi:hypothetical protein HPB48_016876 [Haemaphysalis longicornis]|uniref:DNA helicase n=1 Tax=Haemaphysalis longicornis TaxID=44386 RepID=A0A9J6FBS8_HAELO|nr:hypothetical protein HPB48_016876 [Haemaphysalis longicornis]
MSDGLRQEGEADSTSVSVDYDQKRTFSMTRRDINTNQEFYTLMRQTNAEQYAVIREVIHRITTPGTDPLRVFLMGPAGCVKTFVLRLIIDVYNRYYNANNGNFDTNAYAVCASTGKVTVTISGGRVQLSSTFTTTADCQTPI